MADKVITPVWSRLSAADKRFLFAMLPDTANSSLVSIGDRLGKPSAHVHLQRQASREGVVTESPLGDLAFTSVAVRYRATQEQALEAMSSQESLRLSAQVPTEDTPSGSLLAPLQPPATCGVPMPRAKKPCVLPEGHSGPHRSVLPKPR